MGLFVRTGKGRNAIKHEYGPSPSQLFSRYRNEQGRDILAQLAAAYTSQLKYELTGSR
jgi:predicted ArsR family transcriptional regulator